MLGTPYLVYKPENRLKSGVHAPKTPAPVVTTEYLRGVLDARGIDAQWLPMETVWHIAEDLGLV